MLLDTIYCDGYESDACVLRVGQKLFCVWEVVSKIFLTKWLRATYNHNCAVVLPLVSGKLFSSDPHSLKTSGWLKSPMVTFYHVYHFVNPSTWPVEILLQMAVSAQQDSKKAAIVEWISLWVKFLVNRKKLKSQSLGMSIFFPLSTQDWFTLWFFRTKSAMIWWREHITSGSQNMIKSSTAKIPLLVAKVWSSWINWTKNPNKIPVCYWKLL